MRALFLPLVVAALTFAAPAPSASPAPAPIAAPTVEVPFEQFGREFLKNRLKAKDVAEAPVEKLLDEHCLRIPLGIFDVRYPEWWLGDKQHVEDLKTVCVALVKIQAHWIQWLAKDDPKAKEAVADAEKLAAWIGAWKTNAFVRFDAAKERNVFKVIPNADEAAAQSVRLRALVADAEVLGAAPREGKSLDILFAPNRRDFVELLGYAGLLDPKVQPSLWHDKAGTWTGFWIGWNYVLAMEYPPWGDDPQFKTGLSMNKFEKTGLAQHTIQQVMLAFLWLVYGDNDALHLNQAQAMNMAIEICGEINALEGDGGRGTTGAKTAPYEKFVPGGASSGGTLPPMPAAPLNALKENQWHKNLGRDHFLEALRNGQKEGFDYVQKKKPKDLDKELLKDRTAHFLLIEGNGQWKHAVSAPFFGQFSKVKPYPPQELVIDYKEFFRAYRSSFAWFIQSQGAKDPAVSAKKYEELLRALAKREAGKSLDDLVLEIYGLPLSGRDGETDSLEWRFLAWIAKGK